MKIWNHSFGIKEVVIEGVACVSSSWRLTSYALYYKLPYSELVAGTGEQVGFHYTVDYFCFSKKIILIFDVKKLNNLCEIDVRYCLLLFFGFSFVFSKSRKNMHGCFFFHFVPLILIILAPKIMEEWNNQLQKLWFLQATEAAR